jgi:hypothetical protein
VVVETRAADGKPTARQVRSFKWSGSAFVGSGLANATIQTSGAPSTFITVALDSTMPLAVTVPGSIGALARTDTGPNHQWLFTIAALGPNTTVSGRLLLAMDPAAVAGAPRSGPLNIVLTGVDVDTDQANSTTTNKGKLTISRP